MNIDYVMMAHGIGRGKKVTPPSVQNFKVSQNAEGTLFTLVWTNPTEEAFAKVEVYASTLDLAARDYKEVVSVATKVVEGKTVTSATYTTTPNTTYYFKAYAIYDVFGQIKNDKGVTVALKATDTVPPETVTNLTVVKEDNASVALSWKNPTDADFSKVTVVYKTTGFPTSKNDGITAYTGTGTATTVTSLVNDTKHYFSVFAEDSYGNVSGSAQISATPTDLKIYGVKIDTNNSNPETALTYTDDATGFTPAKMNFGTDTFSYGSWENVYPFNQIKPCVVKNGVVNYYLNPNDYSKKVDGTTADITTGDDGDVMIEFPKIWWKFETIGTDIYIRYATKQKDSTYKCLAHQRGTTEKDKVYVSAYLGSNISSKLRSLSGKTSTALETIGDFRTLAKANGSSYDQMAYYQLLMLQVLYTVMFKNRNSQTALGRGYVSGNGNATMTGGLNTKGLFYGEATGKVQMKFCGVEDFYGNRYYWIDGFFSDSSRNMLIGNQNFNDIGGNYTNYGQGATANLSGYLSSIQGGTETGFVAKETSGSATTHYTDSSNLTALCLPFFGGHFSTDSSSGAFNLRVDNSASNAGAGIGARLMFC